MIDCTGSAKGLEAALKMTEPRGNIILKSTVHEPIEFDMSSVIVNEILLMGSRCGPFAPVIELLRNRSVEVDGMVTAEYPLEQAAEAFSKAAEKGVLKVLLRP